MMDTSKTSSIKSLLLRAWRERWSDLQWGIYIKQVLPRGVSGDVYNLADCILQQALIGPGPNSLVLSYLKHSLSSKLVSYGAVLQSISKYQAFYKPHCILSLLDLLKSIHKRISCHGNAEDCLELCVAMVNCVLWLYSCLLQSLQKLAELKQSPEHSNTIDKSCELLKNIMESIFMKALLYVGKYEDQTTYNNVMQKCSETETQLNQMQGSIVPKEAIDNVLKSINSLDDVALMPMLPPVPNMLVSSLNGMVALDAILSPSSDPQALVEQILLLQKMQNLSWNVVYCEMVRACLMGLYDSYGGNEEMKWLSFTFLKLPLIILKSHTSIHGSNGESKDLEEGFELLLNYTPLLDLTDTKCNSDCLQFLLNAIQNKTGLFSEAQVKQLLQKRQNVILKVVHRSPEQMKSQSTSPDYILRAEPTVDSILKTLDSDYSKNQDALLGVLCKMMSGKSFELILAAAAATGKLQSFAIKLIKFNEFSKQISGEGSKSSQTRALLFDFTFLMLCHIVQQYGTDVFKEIAGAGGETKDSFFEQWANESLAEGGKYKSPDLMVQRAEPNKVDILLSQFSSTDGDLKTSLVKWHEVCINAPAAIKEVLLAWEHGCVTTDNVKVILDNIKSHMCCLPVCISAWLCSYINIVHHDHRIKPMSILQEFQKPLIVDQNASDTALSQGNTETSNFYKERAGLMIAIIKRMFYNVHPPNVNLSKIKPNVLMSKTPVSELLETELVSLHTQGWIDLKTIHAMENLLTVGGPQWFTRTLIKLGMNFVHNQELQRSVDLLFALFQLDIEACTLALLTHVLPSYLQNLNNMDALMEPCASALARLSIMCIYSALQAKYSQRTSASKGKKSSKKVKREADSDLMDCFQSGDSVEMGRSVKYRRTIGDVDVMELDDAPMASSGKSKKSSKKSRREADSDSGDSVELGRPTKYRRTMTDVDMMEFDDTLNGMLPGGGSQSGLNSADPLYKAIDEVFRLFGVIASDPMLTTRTHFVFLFLRQSVVCGKDQSRMLLHFMPLNLVSKMIKCLPDQFTTELVLTLCDTHTSVGRKAMARMLCQLSNYQAQQRACKNSMS